MDANKQSWQGLIVGFYLPILLMGGLIYLTWIIIKELYHLYKVLRYPSSKKVLNKKQSKQNIELELW